MTIPSITRRRFASIFGLLSFVAMAAPNSFAKGTPPPAGAAYTLSNEAAGNHLIVFLRTARGVLIPGDMLPTGGAGSGGGLHNQGALAMNETGTLLFAVNPGDDTISTFSLRGRMPRLTQVIPSGGHIPNSIAVHHDLVYVLHTGGDNGGHDSINGFKVKGNGLIAIPGSSQPLSGPATSPAQIGFTPKGDMLLVTEHGANNLTTYRVNSHGVASPPRVQPSSGKTPFGFGFLADGKVVVSEAQGGAAGASTVSLYAIATDGTLTAETASLPTHQSAACWIGIDSAGHAYTTNTASATVSGLKVNQGAGTLSLLNPNGAATAMTGPGSKPTDIAIFNGRVIYVLNSGLGQIIAFDIKHDGSLKPLDIGFGFPAGGTGLIVR